MAPKKKDSESNIVIHRLELSEEALIAICAVAFFAMLTLLCIFGKN
jgi:hypothetical protein